MCAESDTDGCHCYRGQTSRCEYTPPGLHLQFALFFFLFLLCLVQSSSRGYLCAWNSPHALHPISLKTFQCSIWNSSRVHLIDDDLSHPFKEDSFLSVTALVHFWWKKSETRMTASILKQDPDAHKSQKNTYLLWPQHTICKFSG